jgi:hypothetical protein
VQAGDLDRDLQRAITVPKKRIYRVHLCVCVCVFFFSCEVTVYRLGLVMHSTAAQRAFRLKVHV